MTKENVIELNLNVEEIDGPPVSYFEIDKYRPDSNTFHLFLTPLRFSYSTYSIGIKGATKPIPAHINNTLKTRCVRLILSLYESALYQKPEGFETDYNHVIQPLIVWRKRPSIMFYENKVLLTFRLVFIPPQQVTMVKEYLKSLENSND